MSSGIGATTLSECKRNQYRLQHCSGRGAEFRLAPPIRIGDSSICIESFHRERSSLNLRRAVINRIRITLRCTRRGGWPFVAAIALDALAQLVKILATFVPLKVLYLLGQASVPATFHKFWPAASLEIWTWGLTVVAVGLFFAMALLALMARRLGALAGRNYVESIRGVQGIEPSLEKQVRQAFRDNLRLTTDYAMAIWFLLLLPVVDFGFFLIVSAVLGVCIGSLGLIAAAGKSSQIFLELWQKRYERLVEYVFLLGFMLFFFVLVAVLLHGYELGFLYSLVVLMLTRRSYQAFERAIKRHRVLMQKDDARWLLM